ncbi:hypothetical protein DRN86_03705, partial [Candidatus Geothermarchaeota archaeon]
PNRLEYIHWPATINIISKGERVFRQRTSPLRIVAEDKYFEYLVCKKLEELGFTCEWLGIQNPKNPDIRAYFKLYPNEIFDVECTMLKRYNLHKLHADYGKFITEKRRMRFNRLLIVSYSSDITTDVIEKIQRYDDLVSIIRYKDLLQLVEQKNRGIISKQEVYIRLIQRGEIKLPETFRVNPVVKKEVVLEYLFRFP